MQTIPHRRQSRPFPEPGANQGRFTFQNTDQEKGRLIHDNADPGEFAGAKLAAHVPVHDIGWLIITDCDCPDEETLFLYLLDSALTLLDQCQIGGAHTPGILEGVEDLGHNRYRILFPSRTAAPSLIIEPRQQGLIRKTTGWLHTQPA